MAQAEDAKEEVEEEEVIRPSFKLTYFPFAGTAASIRLCAHVGGIAYTDEFVSVEECKARGVRWKGLPEITVYGEDNKAVATIGQSNACLRYIGSLCGMYSESAMSAALIDEILDSVEDTRGALAGAMDSKESRKALVSEDGKLVYWLKKFEARLKENKERGSENGFVVGNDMSVADLKLFELFHGLWLQFEEDEVKELIASYPSIQAHYQLVMGNEAVQEFLQKFSLRNSEYKLDPTDEDIKVQTYKGKFVSGAL